MSIKIHDIKKIVGGYRIEFFPQNAYQTTKKHLEGHNLTVSSRRLPKDKDDKTANTIVRTKMPRKEIGNTFEQNSYVEMELK